VIRLYENFIAELRIPKGWSQEINFNIVFNQGCLMSPILFSIYIEKLEYCLEVTGCVGTTLSSIEIVILLYVVDIVVMTRNLYDLNNQLRILKEFFTSTCMIVNTEETKVMIIKSNKITYDTFLYDNNILD